ncbi:MAG: ScyD/ScyE family protein [Acidobacteriota bacterium]|nr:MAG: ScyD/ScyE family protein [Acidobacteriota bacterium]
MNRNDIAKLFLIAIGMLGLISETLAQTTTTVTTGLTLPSRVIKGADNSLLITESGTSAPNTGRISIVDRTNGTRRTLVSGLPSGVNNLGGSPVPSGPTGLDLRGISLFVTIGPGDAVTNVGPGLELPTGTASSPLFDSVLEFFLPWDYANLESEFVMKAADQHRLNTIGWTILKSSYWRFMLVRLVANLPDYRPEPRPNAPNNVRSSNLYGVEAHGLYLYVADASHNKLHKIPILHGASSTFVEFPNRPNPLFPNLGGPFIEPVPDGIHRVGDTLLVPMLTGFPFVEGFSEIQAVNIKTGSATTFIGGLTSAIDVTAAPGGSFYALEYSANQLAGTPGRLKFFETPSSPPTTVVANLITPSSMVLDHRTGEMYVTEMFTGRLIRVSGLPH